MNERLKKIGVIGEGRAGRTRQQDSRDSRDSRDPGAPSGASASGDIRTPYGYDGPPRFGVNICVELFDGQRLYKPIHAPCCSAYGLSSSFVGAHNASFNSANSFFGFWSPRANDHQEGNGEDFEQFMSKFKNLEAVWERERSEREAPAQENQETFGTDFDNCSANVQMFFMKYAMSKEF